MFYRVFSLIRKHKIMFFIIVLVDLSVTFVLLHWYTKMHFLEKSENYLSMQLWQEQLYDKTSGIAHIHHEDRLEDFLNHHHYSYSSLPTIAIGLALTSMGVTNVSADNIRTKIPFLRTFLPSFCKTSTQGYSYHFYAAFDKSDSMFTDERSSAWFIGAFYTLRRTQCSYVSDVHLHMIECDHSKKPAWAQNDAMMEAYLDNMQYYYRVNDDTVMKSPGWTELYISTLASADPANIGVVGPKHEGGNHDILTYDFVHRKHIEIFGFYYPRVFTDWFADNWITKVYLPNRTMKLPQVKVLHTQILGKRYSTHLDGMQNLEKQIHDDQSTLNIYLRHMQSLNTVVQREYAISFTLTSFHPDQVYGFIRNVNLIRLYLPHWTVHMFVRHNPKYSEKGRIHRKLTSLNVTVHYVVGLEQVPDHLLGYLIADEKQVQRFLVRDVLGRVSEREAGAVAFWEKSGEGFHCIRDHPSHNGLAVLPGLWGARHNALMQALGTSMSRTLQEYFMEGNRTIIRAYMQTLTNSGNLTRENKNDSKLAIKKEENYFLHDVIWPKVRKIALCHDSLFCDMWPRSVGFPSKRQSNYFVGMKYKAFEVPESRNSSLSENISSYFNDKCS